MATNQVMAVHIGNRQDTRRSWATCCATANDVSAKRLEVYLTMQRQYAEQLKLSQALSARLDVMASQSMVLQEVLLAALAKLDSARSRSKRKVGASGAESDGIPSDDRSGQTRKVVRLQPPATGAAAATTAAPRISSASVAAVALPQQPVVPSYSSREVESLVVKNPLLIPLVARPGLLANVTAIGSMAAATAAATPSWSVSHGTSDARCLPPPPHQQPQPSSPYIASPMSPSQEPSLPAAPPSTCSTAATGPLAPTNSYNHLTINEPTIRPQLTDALQTASAPPAAAAGYYIETQTDFALMDAATAISGVSNKRVRQSMARERPQTPPESAQERIATGGSSSESAASRGGCCGDNRKSDRHRHENAAVDVTRGSGPRPPANAIAPQQEDLTLGAPTALHNPLVFTPSYFSHPHVVQQLLQLQGQLRRDSGDPVPPVRPESVVRHPSDSTYLSGCQAVAAPASAAAAALRIPGFCPPSTTGQFDSCGPLMVSVFESKSVNPDYLADSAAAMAASLGLRVPGSSPISFMLSAANSEASVICSEVGPGTMSEPWIDIQTASPSQRSSNPPASAADCSQEWASQASVSPPPLASLPPAQGPRSNGAASSTPIASLLSWQSVRPMAGTGLTVGCFPLPNGFHHSRVAGGVEGFGLEAGLELF